MQSNQQRLKLRKTPAIAWPTVILFLIASSIWWVSLLLVMNGIIHPVLAIIASSTAVYAIYITLHDASHNAVFAGGANKARLNTWFGSMGMFYFHPLVSFCAFRFLHMQHHRFTNDPDKDPDMWNTSSASYYLPLKWFSLDIGYLQYYLKCLKSRPLSEIGTTIGVFLAASTAIMILTYFGYLLEVLLYWLLPARIGMFFLVFTLDYLPHHPKNTLQSENPYQATKTRIGLDWLLSPLLLNQNYHVIHHLYPIVPFYEIRRIWKENEPYFIQKNPWIVGPFS